MQPINPYNQYKDEQKENFQLRHPCNTRLSEKLKESATLARLSKALMHQAKKKNNQAEIMTNLESYTHQGQIKNAKKQQQQQQQCQQEVSTKNKKKIKSKLKKGKKIEKQEKPPKKQTRIRRPSIVEQNSQIPKTIRTDNSQGKGNQTSLRNLANCVFEKFLIQNTWGKKQLQAQFSNFSTEKQNNNIKRRLYDVSNVLQTVDVLMKNNVSKQITLNLKNKDVLSLKISIDQERLAAKKADIQRLKNQVIKRKQINFPFYMGLFQNQDLEIHKNSTTQSFISYLSNSNKVTLIKNRQDLLNLKPANPTINNVHVIINNAGEQMIYR